MPPIKNESYLKADSGRLPIPFLRKPSACLPFLLLGLAGSSGALAQGLATLRGTVSDASGAVIPSATVTLTQEGTGQARSVTTNNEGNYVMPALPPAGYVVTAQAPGFRQSTRCGITLLADKSVPLNIEMELGDVTQTLTVEA